jgi:glycosyltransferase involved in cell wall biosynthesis
VLVLPEYLGAALADAEITLPVVIFNQNAHGTFRGCGLGEREVATIYTQPNVLGVVVVSDHNRQYLEYAFEDLDVYRVVNGVDTSLFHPHDSPRRRQVAFMPRKKASHLEQLINILKARGALDGWSLAPICGLDEEGVASILRQSFLYLSTCVDEGFGLPPVEAGMAGCLVVGYTGIAAEEYFKEGLAEPVRQDDVLAFAKAVERLLEWVDSDEAAAIARGQAFSAFLGERYSLEREAESVFSAWQSILAKL